MYIIIIFYLSMVNELLITLAVYETVCVIYCSVDSRESGFSVTQCSIKVI